MGNPIPIQERSVDPYSSYDSNVVNKLTRIISDGNNILLQPSPMYCEFLTTTSVRVKAGKAVMDDVLIEIQDIDLNFNDPEFYAQSINEPLTDLGYYLVVLKYEYAKTSPAPSASVLIIKPFQKSIPEIFNRSTMLFINAIRVMDVGDGIHAITEILGYDPDELTLKRTYAGGGSGGSAGSTSDFRDIVASGATTPDDNNIAVNTTTGHIFLSLPLIATTSQIIRIVKISADINAVTVTTSDGDTIEGALQLDLNEQYEAVTLLPYKPTNTWIRV